ACSSSGATKSDPNGSIDFLNCGISKSNPNSKWKAPKVTLKDLKVISADQAANTAAFKACAKYEGSFKSAEKSSGIPAVVLMSFAMQESTCNPSVKGGNGEIGMMQLTPDKCGGKNCWDVTTNIATGAHYFKDEIDRRGGNFLAALGAYNGWQDNQMSYASATSQQYGCHAQNNLDYLMQMLNYWFQGKMGYEYKHYNNLGSC
ncbi:lysozyme-like protein, partial [Ceraceosorus guamensis]